MEDLQPCRSDDSGAEADPARPFGLVDVVEAFTAMRHDWRTNTKETRQLVDLLREATQQVEANAQQARNSASVEGDDLRAARNLAIAVCEIDHALERAVAAAYKVGAGDNTSALALRSGVESAFREKSWIARWRAKAWHAEVLRIIDEQPLDATVTGIVGGLELIQSRVRRLMSDCDIERIEVAGAAFDGDCMNAIDSVDDASVPSGHVAEQLKAEYRWRAHQLVYAEVRVAR